MRQAFITGMSITAATMLTAAMALAQAGADYEVSCTEALAEQEGAEVAEVQVGPAEEVEGVMRVNLTLADVAWVCTLDEAGAVASVEPAAN